VVLLDIGVQATQVTNIALIYGLDSKANSRINTVYMTSYFIGGATGAFVSLICWKMGGWEMVTWQMIAFAVLACVVVIIGKEEKVQN
jgi:predicted MFS family arabinose efflux permease